MHKDWTNVRTMVKSGPICCWLGNAEERCWLTQSFIASGKEAEPHVWRYDRGDKGPKTKRAKGMVLSTRLPEREIDNDKTSNDTEIS